MTDQPLRQPVDRYTFRFDRFYPHPITLVWAALTRAEHVDSWLSPGSQIDARPGGRFSLSFGGPAAPHLRGTIETFRPYTLVVYAFDNGDRMCFELSPVRHGTRIVLTHSVAPGSPDPDGTGTPSEDAPYEASPRRPRFTDTGAVRAVWRIIKPRHEDRSDGRRHDAAQTRDVRVWRRPRPSDRHDRPRPASWDGRCRHHLSRSSPVHTQGPADAARLDFGDRTGLLSLPRVIGAAQSPDGVLRVVVRWEQPRLLHATPVE